MAIQWSDFIVKGRKLMDKSKVWDVVGGGLWFKCEDEAHAKRLLREINNCVEVCNISD